MAKRRHQALGHSASRSFRDVARFCIVSCFFSLFLAYPGVAWAECMEAPTAELRALANSAGYDPYAVLARTQALPAQDEASLWKTAARAEAYDLLSRTAKAYRLTVSTLPKVQDKRSPLYVELVTRHAFNGFEKQEIGKGTALVATARRYQRSNSVAAVCLLIAQGEMERLDGRPEAAVVTLTSAYRTAMRRGWTRQRVLAADKLARVMAWSGDFDQALSLVEEEASWDRENGRRYSLSNDIYFRGLFKLNRRQYREAIADFEEARALPVGKADPSGNAFFDLQTCRALIELRDWSKAVPLCTRAEHAFRSFGDNTSYQAKLQLARIALAQGHNHAALRMLNDILDHAATFPGVQGDLAYRLRATVYDNLGQPSAAYADLSAYLRVLEQRDQAGRDKQVTMQRARFAADREAARSRELQKDLLSSQERERERKRQDIIYALCTVLLFALLVTVVVLTARHRRRLTHIANTDGLTGILNRRALVERATALIGTHVRQGWPLAVAIVDLDHFKAINDRFGHDVGDEVLVRFTQIAVSTLRAGDIIARWGGEEFIVLFPRTSLPEANRALQRVHEILRKEVLLPTANTCVSFSAGLCMFSNDLDFGTMVICADKALYRAKGNGRDRTVTFDATMLEPRLHAQVA